MSETSQGPGWWLASDGKWYPPESHATSRPADKSAMPSWLLIGGSAAVVLGAFLPWATATVFGITINKNGTDGDGLLTLGLCTATLILGIVLLRGSTRRSVGIWSLVLLGLAAFVGVYDTIDVSRVAGNKAGSLSVGSGLWLTDLGVIVAVIGSILWLRSRSPRAESQT